MSLTKFIHSLENNHAPVLPALIPIVRAQFPELPGIYSQIYNSLGRSLMSSDPNVRNHVIHQQISTVAGGMDLISRINAILG